MADDYGPYRDAWHPDNTTAFRYGVVRIEDGTHDTSDPTKTRNPGLYIHNNSGHISVGIEDVWIEPASGYLHVETDGALNGVPLVTGDETAAVNRYLFGASGGNGYINIKCSDDAGFVNLANQSEYTAFAKTDLNLWIAFLSPLNRGVA